MTALVGIVCDSERHDGMTAHRAGDEYVAAVRDGARALPLLIPVTDPPLAAGDILARVDGLLFTGAVSNVAPALYGDPRPGAMPDPARDATSLGLLRAAIAAGKPTLCICRGFQELNVALGGTLDPQVHDTPGRQDHREDAAAPLAVQYGPAHPVRLTPGGLLASWLGVGEVTVNSLHHQGIAQLAPGLFVEATAPDGLVEAVTLPQARGFLLGVQWHPEWNWAENPVNRAIWAGFGAALRHDPARIFTNGNDKKETVTCKIS